MSIATRTKRLTSVSVILTITCFGLPTGADAQVPEARRIAYAVTLLKDNDIEVSPATIRGVLSDGTETVVWINQHHKGLPAFYQDVGYVFDGAGLLDRRPGSDEPLVLGNPAPDSAFPADIEPRLSQAETVMIIGNIRRGKVLTGC